MAMTDGALQQTQPDQTLATVSVGDFFQQINWYNRALSVSDEVAIADTPYETVGQFFDTFPWQGSSPTLPSDDWDTASDTPVIEDIPPLTLDDLSALF